MAGVEQCKSSFTLYFSQFNLVNQFGNLNRTKESSDYVYCSVIVVYTVHTGRGEQYIPNIL